MISIDLLGVLFALTSAFVWGSADFSGGMATRRSSQFHVLAQSALSGIFLLILFAVVWGETLPSPGSILWAALAGASGAIGLAALYQALSLGQAVIVAPTSAVLSAALPVLFSVVTEGWPKPTQLAGFGLALLGIWLVSKSTQTSKPSKGYQKPGFLSNLPTMLLPRRRFLAKSSLRWRKNPVSFETTTEASGSGIFLALLAGGSFGAFFILLAQVERGFVFTPLVVARLVTYLTALLLLRIRHLPPASLMGNRVALLAGLLDAGGNVFYLLAKQFTRLDVAAVLSSLYPATTVILARIVLKEDVSRTQWLGALFCLAAVALIAM